MPIVASFACDRCSTKKSFKGDVRKAFALLEERGWSLAGEVQCPGCHAGEAPSSPPAPASPRIEVCSDGSCVGSNPGHGGWGWASSQGAASGAAPEYPSTNQRMEILGAIEALEAHANPILLYTDSRYVVDCYTKKWYKGWQRNGWKNKAKEPVKNRDLWERFVRALERHPDLEIQWVKGHQDHELNVKADELARTAAEAGREARKGAGK